MFVMVFVAETIRKSVILSIVFPPSAGLLALLGYVCINLIVLVEMLSML